MSYILNALRKSEQERLAQQPDSVSDRILVEMPQPRQKINKVVSLLIFSNLVIAALFFWFIRKEPATPQNAEIQKTTKKVHNQERSKLTEPAMTVSPPIAPVKKQSEQAPPSIAELAANQKTPKIALPPVKPVSEKKRAIDPPIMKEIKPDPLNQEIKTAMNANNPLKPIDFFEKKPAVVEPKTIPYLSELSPEFRHTVPDLQINVFVYSEQPADRFVMVDMVKYTVGQRINDLIRLKEIRAHSMVVEYNGQTFQIKRP